MIQLSSKIKEICLKFSFFSYLMTRKTYSHREIVTLYVPSEPPVEIEKYGVVGTLAPFAPILFPDEDGQAFDSPAENSFDWVPHQPQQPVHHEQFTEQPPSPAPINDFHPQQQFEFAQTMNAPANESSQEYQQYPPPPQQPRYPQQQQYMQYPQYAPQYYSYQYMPYPQYQQYPDYRESDSQWDAPPGFTPNPQSNEQFPGIISPNQYQEEPGFQSVIKPNEPPPQYNDQFRPDDEPQFPGIINRPNDQFQIREEESGFPGIIKPKEQFSYGNQEKSPQFNPRPFTNVVEPPQNHFIPHTEQKDQDFPGILSHNEPEKYKSNAFSNIHPKQPQFSNQYDVPQFMPQSDDGFPSIVQPKLDNSSFPGIINTVEPPQSGFQYNVEVDPVVPEPEFPGVLNIGQNQFASSSYNPVPSFIPQKINNKTESPVFAPKRFNDATVPSGKPVFSPETIPMPQPKIPERSKSTPSQIPIEVVPPPIQVMPPPPQPQPVTKTVAQPKIVQQVTKVVAPPIAPTQKFKPVSFEEIVKEEAMPLPIYPNKNTLISEPVFAPKKVPSHYYLSPNPFTKSA